MKISEIIALAPSTLKSLAKIIIQSRAACIPKASDCETPIIIMGNGPSLADTIRENMPSLQAFPTLAVNFAANADEFVQLKPRYYVLADPLFFPADPHSAADNVKKLHESMKKVDWPMTLFVPCKHRCMAEKDFGANTNIAIATFNPVGVEAWPWFENMAYTHSWGMPRPRNVLIPSIMIAIAMGYRNIYVVGADHSWMKTLSVDNDNHVVSIQPHFYKDDDRELKRVNTTYMNLPLHSVVMSFYIAFRAYHRIARYARHRGINIYNSTPQSMIDAFERKKLPTN